MATVRSMSVAPERRLSGLDPGPATIRLAAPCIAAQAAQASVVQLGSSGSPPTWRATADRRTSKDASAAVRRSGYLFGVREADQTFGRTRRGAQLRTQYKCAIQSAAARPELPGGVRDPHRLTGPDQGGGGRAEEVGQHGGEQAGRGNRGRPAGCDCLLRRVCQARKRGWPILQQLLDRAASFGSSSDSRQKRPEIRMAGIGPASVSRVANVKVCIARFPDMIWSIEWRGSVLAGTLWGYKLLRSRQIPRNPDRLP
jgi:hypothetical protein